MVRLSCLLCPSYFVLLVLSSLVSCLFVCFIRVYAPLSPFYTSRRALLVALCNLHNLVNLVLAPAYFCFVMIICDHFDCVPP